MTATMADYIRAVRSCVPSGLASEDALSRIVGLAKILPPCPLAGFECRLGANQSEVDFQVQLPHRPLVLSARLLEYPTWRFLEALCEEWLDRSSTAYENISAIGLEFDGADTPAPALFVGLTNAAVADRALLAATVLRLLGDQGSSNVESTLGSCIDALPEGAYIKFVGVMPSRAPNALRVNVGGITGKGFPDYLMAAHWPHSAVGLQPLVSALADLTDDLVLGLDITDHFLPRIGIECILYDQPPREARWNRLLDHLNDLGVCTRAKHQALMSWHGDTIKPKTPDEWPSNLSWGDRLLGRAAISTFYRYVSHLKIVYHPGCALEAKAYLGFCHQWINVAKLAADIRSRDAHVD